MSSAQTCKLSSMKVEIHCQKWIKPAKPTPFHLQKYNLSSIDQLLPSVFIEPIFYYDYSSESEVKRTPGRLLIDLEESLSKILTLYYPFAGRYVQGEPVVLCEDQGVSFVVAKVDRKLREVVNGEDDLRALLVGGGESLQYSQSTPLVIVQVNLLTCGGLAIALGVSHNVADMLTVATFMSAWATTCRLGTLEKVVPPSFSFSSLLPPTAFPLPNNPSTSDDNPPNHVMKRYIFTAEAIAKLKSSITEPESDRYTRVELATAVIARCLSNIERSRKPLVIAQPMNIRSRTALPIEENWFGNIITTVLTICGEKEDGFRVCELAKLIKNSTKHAASEMKKVRDWSELSNKVVSESVEFLEMKKGEKVNLVSISSLCRFPLYEVDFGCGRPSLVSVVPIQSAFIRLMDCRSDRGGVEALVSLKEEDMSCFKQEADILEYAAVDGNV